jgi:hypothetical protein
VLVGAGVRRFALVALLAYAVWATVGFGYGLWSADRPESSPIPPALAWLPLSQASVVVLGILLSLAWLPVFPSVLFGHLRMARRFAAIALTADFLTLVAASLYEPVGPSGWGRFLVEALVVAALAAFHSDVTPYRPRPWLIAYGSGVVLLATSASWTPPRYSARRWYI